MSKIDQYLVTSWSKCAWCYHCNNLLTATIGLWENEICTIVSTMTNFE